MTSLAAFQVKELLPIKDHVIVESMDFSERITNGGIIIPSDDKKSEGIRPRWGKVCAVGPEQSTVKIGDWVLVDHGRWTRGIKVQINNEEKVIRRVDPKDIMIVSDEPSAETWSDAISVNSNLHKIEGSLHNTGIDDF